MMERRAFIVGLVSLGIPARYALEELGPLPRVAKVLVTFGKTVDMRMYNVNSIVDNGVGEFTIVFGPAVAE